jgi:hypothetical protein
MNAAEKLGFSRTMREAAWANTTVISGDPAAEIRARKEQAGNDLTILGSGGSSRNSPRQD